MNVDLTICKGMGWTIPELEALPAPLYLPTLNFVMGRHLADA